MKNLLVILLLVMVGACSEIEYSHPDQLPNHIVIKKHTYLSHVRVWCYDYRKDTVEIVNFSSQYGVAHHVGDTISGDTFIKTQ